MVCVHEDSALHRTVTKRLFFKPADCLSGYVVSTFHTPPRISLCVAVTQILKAFSFLKGVSQTRPDQTTSIMTVRMTREIISIENTSLYRITSSITIIMGRYERRNCLEKTLISLFIAFIQISIQKQWQMNSTSFPLYSHLLQYKLTYASKTLNVVVFLQSGRSKREVG